MYYHDGSVYEGTFKDDLRFGYGTHTGKNELDLYDGQWDMDKHHGKGMEYIVAEGRYEGEWHYGVKQGLC